MFDRVVRVDVDAIPLHEIWKEQRMINEFRKLEEIHWRGAIANVSELEKFLSSKEIITVEDEFVDYSGQRLQAGVMGLLRPSVW